MKVLFLEIDSENTWAVASIGTACLAAYLREQGHQAEGLRISLEMPITDLWNQIEDRKPGLIGVSLTTRQWLRGRQIVGALRREPEIPVVAGGLHPTFSPRRVLDSPGFDFVCLGEGEAALVELVERLEADRMPAEDNDDEIPNIWTKGQPRPSLRKPYVPVDDLPYMARDLLDEQYGVVHMTTQRGCPFPCTYCAAGQYHQLYGKASEYGRRRSHQNVLSELALIRDRGELNYIIFLDDTFTIYPSWVLEFCEQYPQEFKTPFSIHARVDTVNREMIQSLAAAGCRHIVYGVESGSYRVRKEIMHRPITNQQMIEAFRLTREAGILVTANYMMGLPFETKDDLEQTLALQAELDPDDFGYFVFYPYPGTKLFQICLEQNLLPEHYDELPAVHRESILNLPDLTQGEISEYYDRFTQLRIKKQIERLGGKADEQTKAEIRESTSLCADRG